MLCHALHLRVGRSCWAAVLMLVLAASVARASFAQAIAVTDAVSREVAVFVDPSIGQQKQQLVTDAVSREVAVLVDSTAGQPKDEFVRDAVSREYAVLVGGTGGGTTTDLLVRDAVSREIAVRVDPIDSQQKSDFVLDAVSREIAVRVDPIDSQQKSEFVLDAVSREIAVRVDPIDGQLKTEFVLDAVSRELAVRVEPTFGFDKGQLVRDSVSREFQIYVNPTDANNNGIADLLEPTVETVAYFAASVPNTNSGWRDEGEAAGNPGCGEVCPCNSQFEPYAFNGGQGVPADTAFLVGAFSNIQIPSNRVVSSVVADVMCRFNDGSSGAVDLRVNVGAQQLLLANQTFTSTTGCEFRFGGAGRVQTAPTGGWTPEALSNATIAVRRSGSNNTTLRVTAFRLTVTTVERDTDGDGIADSLDNCPNNANPLQQDCDSNGIGDACELLLYPERDANMNGVIDACENVAGWVGGLSGAFNNPANWSSGRVPDAGTALFLRGPADAVFHITTSSPVTVKSMVVAGGTVRLSLGAAFRVNELFTVSSGAVLVVDSPDAPRTLELAGFSQVRGGGRLEIAPSAVVRALASGSFAGEPLSNLTFVLRPSGEVPFEALGATTLRGGIAVKLGAFAGGGLEVGTRFTLIRATNISTGFYSTLSAQGLETKFLKVVSGEFVSGQFLGADSLILEVDDLQEFVRSAGGANQSVGVGEEPTAIAAKNFTAAFDAFDDIAVTVRRADAGGVQLPGNLYVFRGDGAGGIAEQAVYPTGLEPIAVESADLDGDGTFDLAVLTRTSRQLQVFRNPQSQVDQFTPQTPELVAVGATYLALSPLFNAASLNPAVAGFAFLIASPSGGTIQPGKIVGGNVTPFPTIPVPTNPGPVTPIDDSGREEGAFMATRSAPVDDEYGRAFKVEVLGNGTVTQGPAVLSPAQPLAIETGALNSDGFTDMVIAGLSSAQFGSVPSVSVFPGTSIGFATGGAIPLTDRPLGLAIGDFDGDAKNDFVIALGTVANGVEQGDFVRRFNNVTEAASNPVFKTGATDVLLDGEGVRRIRRAELNALPPDDFAVLGDSLAGGGSLTAGGNLIGYGGGRVFELTFEPTCAGDINRDGTVDVVDLASLLSAWGGPGAADFDGSDEVDASDLALLLDAWGACNAAD
jgi:hypothetical protein